jgi:PmbA protein
MDILGMVQRAVDKALQLDADQVEAFAMLGRDTSFSVKRNRLEFGSQHEDFGIGIRVLKDRRIGFSYCTSDKGAAGAVSNAIDISWHSKPLDGSVENAFALDTKLSEAARVFDSKIFEMDPGHAAEMARQLIDAAESVEKSLNLSGGAGYGVGRIAIANSNGLHAESARTFLSGGIWAMYKGESASVGSEWKSSHVMDIDFQEIGRTAADLALAGRGPRRLEKTDLPVVFHQDALSNMLEFITCPSMVGPTFQKGESVYSGRMSERVASELLDMRDDALLPNGPNTDIMDDEGVPSTSTSLLQAGVLNGAVYDNASSQSYGVQPTGNALRSEQWSSSRSFKAMPKASIRNLVIGGKTISKEKLMAEVGEGIYVHEVLGAHTSNPASGDFSVSVPQLFKIENGEVAHPLKQVMLGGNWPKALENIIAIGDDHKGMKGHLSPVGLHIPTMAVGGIKISQ